MTSIESITSGRGASSRVFKTPAKLLASMPAIATALLFCAAALRTPAQLLSVDINGGAGGNNTAPGFTAWNVGAVSGANVIKATQYFTNYAYTFDPNTGLPTATNISLIIPCTVAMTTPSSASSTVYLYAKNANKNGYSTSADPSAGWRLAIDGAMAYYKDDTITVDQPYTNGGAISLTISNLPAGVHSFTTYHNDPWGPAGATWHTGVTNISRCIISANGVAVFTNTPTIVSTNDGKCGFAFFQVTNSYDGQPVVLNFDPDHSSILDFTILNGFEIDRPSAPGMTATELFPAPGDEHVFANNDVPAPGRSNAGYLTLQWAPAGFALTNYLYFGTNSDAVANATRISAEYKGETAAITGATNNYDVTNLDSALTYFWRVDQLDVANGTTNLAKGYVWNFRTRHLAFPGAEGYGRWARGGRGGVVIEVTNLNDSGPGSYRAAIQASGPRTVIFKVSGLIRLQSQCIVGNGYLTIAGQTAPGEGVCIANWRAGMSGPNDVVMRYMHFRTGDSAKQSMDAMSLGSATHTIVDHCSLSWSLDVACNSLQSGSVGSQAAMTSFQKNIISEPLRYSYHYNDTLRSQGYSNVYQPHAFGASISGEIGSYHHNLIAHSTDRNWSMAGGLDQSVHYGGSLDMRNNVVYNFGARTTDGGVARANYVNNYYKRTPANLGMSANWLLMLDSINTNWGTPSYYMAGNVLEGTSYYTNNWMNGSFRNGLPMTGLNVSNAEIFPSYVTTQSASNAYKVVLSDVGCNLPGRDLIDQRVIGEVIDGTTHYIGTNGPHYTIDGYYQSNSVGPDNPGFIDSQTDVHDYTNDVAKPNYSANYPWPPYATYNVPRDTDHDGLPDWWEVLRGFNTNSAVGDFSDANADLTGDGYTELERYLNWMATPHYDCNTGATLNVDLTQYTRGFTNNGPTYAVFGAVNGTVALSGNTAQFTPGISTNGLGTFFFKVTDTSNFSYTNTVNVHIIAAPLNTAPTLMTINNRTINVGLNLSITNVATDADVPAQALTFSLPVAATNAAIDPLSGVLNWRPLVTQAATTNQFQVVVTDNGSPSLSATQNFSVIVRPLTAPAIASSLVVNGQMGLMVSGDVGPDYAVQGSSNLVNWDTLLITNPAAMPFYWSTNSQALPAQFYRVKVGPPLP